MWEQNLDLKVSARDYDLTLLGVIDYGTGGLT